MESTSGCSPVYQVLNQELYNVFGPVLRSVRWHCYAIVDVLTESVEVLLLVKDQGGLDISMLSVR